MKSLREDVEYKSTAIQWEEFLKSTIWFDLQLFIVDKIEVQQGRLVLTLEERINTETYSESDDMLRGRIREASDLLNVPNAIYQELVEMEEDEKSKKT